MSPKEAAGFLLAFVAVVAVVSLLIRDVPIGLRVKSQVRQGNSPLSTLEADAPMMRSKLKS